MKRIACIFFLLCSLSACGAAPCTTERAIVSAVDVGVGAAGEALGDADDDTQEALHIAAGVANLGTAAVEACELLRAGGGWQQWVLLAFEAAGGLLAHFTGAADDEAPPPQELVEAHRLLELELQQ